MNLLSRILLFFLALLVYHSSEAQVSYGAAAAYALRKVIPSYTGNAIQVRRTCYNGTPNGIYFVKIVDSSKQTALKLVVQH